MAEEVGRVAKVSLALIAPDMAPNVGAIIRLAACFDVGLAVVEPCGFPFSPRAWRRQAMDYERHVGIEHLPGVGAFAAALGPRRAVALTARGNVALPDFAFRPGDVLMLGAETAGLPEDARALATAAVRIPIAPPARSLNVAQAAAVALFEALRQTDGLPR